MMRFASFWIYPLAALLLIYLTRAREPGASYRAWVPLGLLTWTLVEYLMHRFFFHARTGNPRLARMLSGFHRAHHAAPRETQWILVRPRTSLPMSLLLMGLLYAATGSLAAMTGVTVGIWAGFLYYEWVHYAVHTSAAVWGLDGPRRRHFRHHFVNEGRAFGVTSPLWDRILGTDLRLSSETD